MKSALSMTHLLATLLSVGLVSAACGQAGTLPTATPTIIPVYTSTPSPTSTFPPSPTFTLTPTLTPPPVLVPITQDAVLYSGPSSDGYEKLIHLPVGTEVEPLGEFGDFVLIRLDASGTLQQGFVPMSMLADVPQFLPLIPVEQLPWKKFMSMASPDKPIEVNNNSDNWAVNPLAHGIYFSDGLQITLNVESMKGSNGIVFQGTGEGVPSWNGQKRIDFIYEAGNLHILLRDGTQDTPIYDSNIPMQIINGITTGEITITFDQFGKSIQISQNNKVAFELTFGNFGDFPNGLFPNRQILSVMLSTGPNASGSLTELVFAAPPDGKYKK